MPLHAMYLPFDSQAEIVTLAWLAAAAVIDLRRRIVPNALIVAGFVLVGPLLLTLPHRWLDHVMAAIASASVLLLLRAFGTWWRGEPGIGMGDVKLALVLGLGLGPPALLVLWGGCMLAGIYGLAGLASRRLRRGTRLPLVPFIFVAAMLFVGLRPFVEVSWP